MKIPFLKRKKDNAPPPPVPAAPKQPDGVQAFLRRHNQAPEQLDLQRLMDALTAAMRAGLRGEGGLPMLPTYLTPQARVPENTPVAVLDAGGTHLRTAVVTFCDGAPLVSRL